MQMIVSRVPKGFHQTFNLVTKDLESTEMLILAVRRIGFSGMHTFPFGFLFSLNLEARCFKCGKTLLNSGDGWKERGEGIAALKY